MVTLWFNITFQCSQVCPCWMCWNIPKESQLDSWLVFFYIIFEDISWALVGPCDTLLLTIHVKAQLGHCPQMSPNEVMNASFSRRFLVLAPAIPCYVMAYQVGFEGDSPPQSSNLNLTPLDSNYGSRRLFYNHVPLSSWYNAYRHAYSIHFLYSIVIRCIDLQNSHRSLSQVSYHAREAEYLIEARTGLEGGSACCAGRCPELKKECRTTEKSQKGKRTNLLKVAQQLNCLKLWLNSAWIGATK